MAVLTICSIVYDHDYRDINKLNIIKHSDANMDRYVNKYFKIDYKKMIMI